MAVSSQAHAGFCQETQVKMANTSMAQIGSMRVGQSVLGFTEDSSVSHHEREARKVVAVHATGTRPSPLVTHVLLEKGGRINASPSQTFVLNDGSLKPANELKSGDLLLRADGTTVAFDFSYTDLYPCSIYSIATDAPRDSVNGHTFEAGGVLVGDMALSGETYYE